MDNEVLLFEGFDLEGEAFLRFRRALRKKDQDAFDSMVRSALERYALQEKLLEHLTPIERLLLLVLMEQHKQLDQLKHRIEKLEALVPPEMNL